jgi:hypothetical protein
MSFEEIFYFVTKKAVSMRFVVFCKRIFIVIKRRQQMISTDEGYMRLEYFSENVAADKKRKEFEIMHYATQTKSQIFSLLGIPLQSIGS